MKHVLVTGGSGFIGSHLCDLLLSKGYAVTAIDNFVTGRKSNLNEALRHPSFRILEWDICEPLPEERLEFAKLHGLFGVLHFACPASPVDFDKIPFEILKVDSLGTMRTVELALKYEARYLLASTSEVYGDPLIHPQTEDYFGNVNSIGPRACYDEAKRFSEAWVSTAGDRGMKTPWGMRKLNAGIVRIFNTYGPRMRPDDGRVVPELCLQALRGEPLTLHGDGKQTRSFCYVSDLVRGIVALFESSIQKPVNLGNPQERTILDFAEVVKALTSTGTPIKFLPARPDDPKRRCPEITRARTLLKWEPSVSIEEGLRLTLEDFRAQV
jgi:nucleoside-diphosphate-sugar epimerase